jgi:hypothetical protein
MRVLIRKTLRHHHTFVNPLVEGIRSSGDYKFYDWTPRNPPSGRFDFGICWGVRNMLELKKYTDNVLLIENAYLNNVQEPNKKEWVSVGWNGLNGRADFCNENSPDDRWRKHFDDGRLLRYSNGEYILVPLQIRGDQSLRYVDKKLTYQWICEEIRKYTDLPIVIKDHPTRPGSQQKVVGVPGVSYLNLSHPIKEVLKNAKAVVTINSNSGVDAVLAGKPTISLDEGSMVWNVSDHDFTKINLPTMHDRNQWCNDIAYAQWHPDELKSGEAWEHLKQKVEISDLQTA